MAGKPLSCPRPRPPASNFTWNIREPREPNKLTVTLIMRPTGGMMTQEWKTRCQQIGRDFGAYLMGRWLAWRRSRCRSKATNPAPVTMMALTIGNARTIGCQQSDCLPARLRACTTPMPSAIRFRPILHWTQQWQAEPGSCPRNGQADQSCSMAQSLRRCRATRRPTIQRSAARTHHDDDDAHRRCARDRLVR